MTPFTSCGRIDGKHRFCGVGLNAQVSEGELPGISDIRYYEPES